MNSSRVGVGVGVWGAVFLFFFCFFQSSNRFKVFGDVGNGWKSIILGTCMHGSVG